MRNYMQPISGNKIWKIESKVETSGHRWPNCGFLIRVAKNNDNL